MAVALPPINKGRVDKEQLLSQNQFRILKHLTDFGVGNYLKPTVTRNFFYIYLNGMWKEKIEY